jgi:hypothetical protein
VDVLILGEPSGAEQVSGAEPRANFLGSFMDGTDVLVQLGMATGRVRVRWIENPTRGKIESGKKLRPDPRVKF